MKRLLAAYLAGVLALAVLATAGWNRDAGAVVPDNPGLAGVAGCAFAEADDPTPHADSAEQVENASAQLLAACQFTKPMNGCKKNPCDGKTYCCTGGECVTRPS